MFSFINEKSGESISMDAPEMAQRYRAWQEREDMYGYFLNRALYWWLADEGLTIETKGMNDTESLTLHKTITAALDSALWPRTKP